MTKCNGCGRETTGGVEDYDYQIAHMYFCHVCYGFIYDELCKAYQEGYKDCMLENSPGAEKILCPECRRAFG